MLRTREATMIVSIRLLLMSGLYVRFKVFRTGELLVALLVNMLLLHMRYEKVVAKMVFPLELRLASVAAMPPVPRQR